jgi:hypothetical protein
MVLFPRKDNTMMRCTTWLGGVALAVLMTGCESKPSTTGKTAASGKAVAEKADHPDHGPHGGAIIEWGDEEYHLEFTVDRKAKQATVYVLDGNIRKPKPIAAQQLTLTLKQPVITVTLEASPQEGDPAGSASRFVGKNEAFGQEQPFAGTVSGEAGGKPYAGDFAEKAGAKGK